MSGIHPHVHPLPRKTLGQPQNLSGANGPGVLKPGPHVERQKEIASPPATSRSQGLHYLLLLLLLIFFNMLSFFCMPHYRGNITCITSLIYIVQSWKEVYAQQ